MKNLIIVSVLIAMILFLASCGAGATADPGTQTSATTTTSSTSAVIPAGDVVSTVEYDKDDLDDGWDKSGATLITLEGNSISVSGDGAAVQGNRVAITAGGTYVVSGTLNDGQLLVDSLDEDTVSIMLNGADISCSSNSPFYIMQSEKTVVTLADGTENYLTDGDEYVYTDEASDEPDAALYSKDDLTINGGGSLTVTGNWNNGIQSKDDLKIISGSIRVTAVNDGIKGKDVLVVKSGTILVHAGGDGILSTEDGDEGKGYVYIEGGSIDITSVQDGIQAARGVVISGGAVSIVTGSGSGEISSADGNWGQLEPGAGYQNTDVEEDTPSAKGIKGGAAVVIQGGTTKIDSSDDALHSDGSITISGGTITAASGDDGVHADEALTVAGGKVVITQSYEGIESTIITIDGGRIDITAGDDGINVSGGADTAAMNGFPGRNMFEASGGGALSINGGYVVIDAGGDGIDVNGTITMTDGTVIINGPVNDGNGAIDYLNSCTVSGGLLIAVGSSGMAQNISANSAQGGVLVNFSSRLAAGTMVHIESAAGKDIVTFVPSKDFQSLLVSSSALKTGETYLIYTGGSSTATVTDGLACAGDYNPGTKYAEFTMNAITATVGNAGAGGMNLPGNGQMGPGFRQR